MFDHVPFFIIFKTPVEKFGLLYTFIFSLLLLFTFHSCKNLKIYPQVTLCLCFYLLFCGIPFVTGKIIPDYYANPYGTVSKKYIDQPEYIVTRKSLNEDKLIYRVLSLPGRGNYQALLDSGEEKLYSGLDPVLLNTNKPIVNDHDGNLQKFLYKNIFMPELDFTLDMMNIKKLVFNDRFILWFGRVSPGDSQSLKQRFKSLPYRQHGKIRIYDRESKFIPLLFSTNSIKLGVNPYNFSVIDSVKKTSHK